MYNHVEHGEAETWRRLQERTRAFFRDAQVDDEASLKAFRKKWEDGAEVKLMTGLPSCPFLGFVDLAEGQGDGKGEVVGCLVHPLQNDGVDGRDCGVYDRFICEDYLCAAHDVLGRAEIRWVLAAVEDSYLYGLVITNPKFVKHLLELVAREVGAMPGGEVLEKGPVLKASRACFELMREWPYRSKDGIFGQVEVAGALDTTRRQLPADEFGVAPHRVDPLLVCLGSRFESPEILEEGRAKVERAVEDLAQAVMEQLP